MLNFIQGSKYQAETVSVVLSFADILQPGNTITGTPVVTVTVATGFDSNPSNLLYQGVTVTSGNTIEQRFRLGIPGVIYVLLFTVVTVAGYTLEKECYLAIIPDADNAVPNWLPLWETTQLYPVQDFETMQGNIIFIVGSLRQTAFNVGPEAIQGGIVFQGGALIQSGILYHIVHEDIQGDMHFIGGALVQVGITYDIPHEDVQGNIAFIGGALIQVGISYANPHEDIQGDITFAGGTLV